MSSKEMGKMLEQEYLQTVATAVSPMVTLDQVSFYQGNDDGKQFC